MHSAGLQLKPHVSGGHSAYTHMTLPLSAGLPPPFVMADLTSPVRQYTRALVNATS
jgi:hypothetical protein